MMTLTTGTVVRHKKGNIYVWKGRYFIQIKNGKEYGPIRGAQAGELQGRGGRLMATGKKRGAPAPRARSGFVTEEQRHTERLNLRLKPEAMAKLRELADCTAEGGKAAYAKVVEAALAALERELDARDAARDAEG